MPDMLSDITGKLVDIAADAPLLEALGELQARLSELQAAGIGWGGRTEALLKILRAPADPKVVAAFGNLSTKLAPLARFADRFEQMGGGMPISMA